MNYNIIAAIVRKETLQILRDPSSILIAFILPLILLFIYVYGINLDTNNVKIGLVLNSQGTDVVSLANAFQNSKFLNVQVENNQQKIEKKLIAGNLDGIVIVPQNFSFQTVNDNSATIQVITDGSEPNTAAFIQGYVNEVIQSWLAIESVNKGYDPLFSSIKIEPRYWYNKELKSRNFIMPGAIAIIMILIGILLTSLIISREWELGTIEMLMSTPISIVEIIIGKLIPYFFLALCSLLLCTSLLTLIFEVPLRGNLFVLICVSSIFLIVALGQGLLISSLSKNQFVSSQLAVISAFLPSFFLSGFIFEINSMPLPIRIITYFIPTRYYIASLKTIFLVGNVWSLLLVNILLMLVIGLIFYLIIIYKTRKRID